MRKVNFSKSNYFSDFDKFPFSWSDLFYNLAARTKLSEQETNSKKLEMQLAQSQKIIEKKRLELASSKRRSTGTHELKGKIENEIAKLEVLSYIF